MLGTDAHAGTRFPRKARAGPFIADEVLLEKLDRERLIEPELVVQVRYREWPAGGALRFPVFVRLRPDKAAEDCAEQYP